MNNPLIMAGSLGRPHLPLLKWIPDPVILIEQEQMVSYMQAHPELEYVVLPKSGQGFSYMMNQMVAEARKRGQRYFVFTDDDVYGFKARNSVADKFTRIQGAEVRLRLAEAVAYCEEHKLAQLAISFAGASWGAKRPHDEPTGSWGVYVCDAVAVWSVGGFDEKLWLFADWEMSARLIKAGYRCARTNLLTFEHKMRGMDGGAQFLYEKKEKVTEACQLIASKYGTSVRIKWIPKHGQHEIRFNWKALNPLRLTTPSA